MPWRAYLSGAAGSLPVVLVSGVLGSVASVAGAEGCPNQQARSEEGWGRLPDCRAYELVSPAEKNGNNAGASQDSSKYSVTSPSGDGLLYGNGGPFGTTASGVDYNSLARRSPMGWASSALLPRSLGRVDFEADSLLAFDSSADLSHILFSTAGSFVPANPPELKSQSLYDAGPEGSISWVGEPAIPDPIPALGHVSPGGLWPAGGSPDLGTVYFTYYGTLVAEDASRAPHVLGEANPRESPWGFYEWRDGRLGAAGELPPGSPNGPFDPYGAVPAAIGHEGGEDTPEEFDNEVSTDGSRAFFVSPDPTYCGVSGLCGADVPELYVRETEGEGASTKYRTVLVSRTEQGQPAADGPLAVAAPHFSSKAPSYVYASPDGSRAFFESVDRLTSTARNDRLAKAYEFDANTDTLAYLSEVADLPLMSKEGRAVGTSPILTSSKDGSRFMFVKDEQVGAEPVPKELDLWSGGRVAERIALPRPASTPTNNGGELFVDPMRATADGSVFVFETDSPIRSRSGSTFNNGGGFEQVYRYDAASEVLSCVSCPPAGVTPSGDASLSNDSVQPGPAQGIGKTHLVPTRGISADGSRVFFDTPEALVPQDINGKRDVYEWENGNVFLISSGTGPEDSFFLDNSESGDDVFFATTDALVPADTDGGFDVYDGRAPHEPNEVVGFPPPVSPAPCLSDCQGLPSAPPALGVPSGSATFSGAGNLAPPVLKPPTTHTPKKKPKRRASTKRRAKSSRRRGHRTTSR